MWSAKSDGFTRVLFKVLEIETEVNWKLDLVQSYKNNNSLLVLYILNGS